MFKRRLEQPNLKLKLDALVGAKRADGAMESSSSHLFFDLGLGLSK